jgi:hypothetical protein
MSWMIYLEISSLRYNPLVNELLRILSETQEELTISFQTVDGFHCLVNLVVQTLRNKEEDKRIECGSLDSLVNVNKQRNFYTRIYEQE